MGKENTKEEAKKKREHTDFPSNLHLKETYRKFH